MTVSEFTGLAAQLVPAARMAGAAIMRHRGRITPEFKQDNSPVTQADRDAERILLDALVAVAPDIPVISEEAAAKPLRVPGQRFFLVDPLDGTKEFINGEEDFTVNIGLIESGRPVFGLIYAPAKAALYVTLAPGEASHAPLDFEIPPGDAGALPYVRMTGRARPAGGDVAAISRSHLDAGTKAFLAERGIGQTISAGSSLKFCLLALGEADVYPRFGRTMEWDTAAGHAILAAAGGVVLDLEGNPLAYGKASREFSNPGFIAWSRKPGNN